MPIISGSSHRALTLSDLSAEANGFVLGRDSGYEAGVEDVGSGELLVETLDLRYALFDLDGKTKRAIALDELVMAVQVDTIEHEEGCGCGLCRALEAIEGDSLVNAAIACWPPAHRV